jgi:hypothetical protein
MLFAALLLLLPLVLLANEAQQRALGKYLNLSKVYINLYFAAENNRENF